MTMAPDVPAAILDIFAPIQAAGLTWSQFAEFQYSERTEFYEYFRVPESARSRLEDELENNAPPQCVGTDDEAHACRILDDMRQGLLPRTVAVAAAAAPATEAPARVTTEVDENEMDVPEGTATDANRKRWAGGDSIPSAPPAQRCAPIANGAGPITTTRPSLPPWSGIRNQGSTCYLNALMQCLFHLTYFRNVVYNMPTSASATDTTVPIPLALQRLFFNMEMKKKNTQTEELTKAFGWESRDAYVQHDVHELTRKLLENLENKMMGTQHENAIKKMFFGQCCSVCRCVDVDYTSRRFEDFYDLELVVKDRKGLIESFDLYTQTERMDGDNKYCVEREEPDGTTTKSYHEADRGTTFASLPPILMLHPTRVDYCTKTWQRITVGSRWEFDTEIDLSKYMESAATKATRQQSSEAGTGMQGQGREGSLVLDDDPDQVYQLHSVMVHGGGAGYGHYYAYVRQGPNEWVKFNDEHVSYATDKDMETEAFGGPVTTYSQWHGNQTHESTRRASMLVYVKKSLYDKIVFDIPMEQLPQHLKDRYQEDLENEKEAEKERETEHLYTKLRCIVADAAGEYVRAIKDYKLVSADNRVRVEKAGSVQQALVQIEEKFGFKNACMWTVTEQFLTSPHYHSDYYSSKKCNLENTVAQQFRQIYYESAYCLVVPEAEEGEIILHVRTYHNGHFSICQPVIFKKLPDVGEKLEQRWKLVAAESPPPPAAPAGVDTEDQPQPPEKQLYVLREMSQDLTLTNPALLYSGDCIVCFMSSDPDAVVKIREQYRWENRKWTIQLYKYLGDDESEEVGPIDVLDDMTYDELQVAVAKHLKDDSIIATHLSFRRHDPHSDKPHQSRLARKDRRTLKSMITSDYTLERIYYEELSMPVEQFESEDFQEIVYCPTASGCNGKKLYVKAPREFTWMDVLKQVAEKVGVAEDGLRVMEIYRNKPYTVFDPKTLVPWWCQASVYRVEGLPQPIPDVPIAEQRQLSGVFFFRMYADPTYYGNAFTLFVHVNDTKTVVMERIRSLLEVTEEDTSKWRLGYFQSNLFREVNDTDTVQQLLGIYYDSYDRSVRTGSFLGIQTPMPSADKKAASGPTTFRREQEIKIKN